MGMGGAMIPIVGRMFGWKGILIMLVLFYLVGRGFFGLGTGPTDVDEDGPADEMESFVGFVLDDTQATWERIFIANNKHYKPADLVLYTESTSTRCGYGTAAVGPFYCPNDQKVYIDLTFYKQLRERFGAPGDFAQAYVIAHEIGHHVQNQLGSLGQSRGDPQGSGSLAVRVELQADCYAGLWARSTKERQILDPGDVDEALMAASAIGDDTLQKRGQGRVQPETWTHGSSEQRMRWFERGYESGDLNACDTFTADKL
jgi:uncharacterized protein